MTNLSKERLAELRERVEKATGPSKALEIRVISLRPLCCVVGSDLSGGEAFVMEDRPFSSEELAERWGVSAQHVRDLIKLGTLRHFRVGRLIRIPAKAVNEFEECQSTGPSSTAENSMPSGATNKEKRKDRPYIPPIVRKQNAA